MSRLGCAAGIHMNSSQIVQGQFLSSIKDNDAVVLGEAFLLPWFDIYKLGSDSRPSLFDLAVKGLPLDLPSRFSSLVTSKECPASASLWVVLDHHRKHPAVWKTVGLEGFKVRIVLNALARLAACVRTKHKRATGALTIALEAGKLSGLVLLNEVYAAMGMDSKNWNRTISNELRRAAENGWPCVVDRVDRRKKDQHDHSETSCVWITVAHLRQWMDAVTHTNKPL